MSFSVDEVHSFLIARWSLPIRRTCPHLPAQERQTVRPKTKVPVPKGIKPQFLQRWLGSAIASRLAWQEQQTTAPRYRFGLRSAPCWSQTMTLPYEGRALRGEEEETLLWYLGMDIERASHHAGGPNGGRREPVDADTLERLPACGAGVSGTAQALSGKASAGASLGRLALVCQLGERAARHGTERARYSGE